MRNDPIDSTEFLQTVCPALEYDSAEDIAQLVRSRWDLPQLCHLLHHGESDARKTVCLTLSLVGDESCVDCLATALHDPEEQVGELAEHALWSIWFREGQQCVMDQFITGLEAMEAKKFPEAIDCFHQTVELDPKFAEAFNQCGMAHFLQEEYDKALADYQTAVKLVPVHFGALEGIGHCYTQMGEFDQAMTAYRRALTIHPRLPGIELAIARLEHRAATHEQSND